MGGLIVYADAFREVHGNPADGEWGSRVARGLVHGGLATPAIRRVLDDRLVELGKSEASCLELFGDADAWVRQTLAEMSERGAAFDDGRPDWWSAVVFTLVLQAVLAVIWAAGSTLEYGGQHPWSPGLILGPLLLPPVIVANVVWQRWLLARLSAGLTALGVLAGAALTIIPTVALLAWRPDLGIHSTWWWLAEIALPVLILSQIDRAWPQRDIIPGASLTAPFQDDEFTPPSTDEHWAARAAGALRIAGLTEAQIDARIDEARSHARDSGASLAEEFGSLEGFAAQLPGNPRRRALWQAIGWTVGLAMQAVLLLTNSRHSPWWYLWLVLFVAFVAREWLRFLRPRRAR